MLQHDAEKAINFLTWAYPAGPWCLTAIEVDRPGIVTATFSPETKDRAAAFIEHHAQCNLYWSVNRPLRDLSKKAEKTDIAAAHFLHVDVDPRAGESLSQERDRILKLLARPPAPIPRPTLVVFSGGGYQALWRLTEPFVIDGEIAKAEELESYNRQLEWSFGADACHNVDRILRLPGSVNFPNAKKRGKGRSIERAFAVHEISNLDATYPLSDFTRAQAIQAPWKERGAPLGSHSPTVPRVPGNVARLASLDALPDSVSLKTKILIAQGKDPEELGPIDRSRVVFHVCCELVRAGVDDMTIYSIITDEAYEISASVRDKGASTERYALRQIERAKEKAISPQLLNFNERFAVIENYGGRCRVIEEQPDPAFNGRPILTFQSFDDFKNRWMHMKIQQGFDKNGVPINVPLGKWWLEQPARRQYTSITFSPGREVEGAYNLWRGFAVEPRPGTKHQRFLEHVRVDLCGDDEATYRYLLSWMARAVQVPNVPGEVAVVLRGRKGTGKGLFAKIFGALFGRHFWQVSDARHIVGNFNAHLRDCVLLFGDEAFWAGDKKHESVLKALITEDTFVVERKGFDAEAAPNYVHLIMASNEQWVVPASYDERRFLVLDVAATHIQDKTYFGAIDADMKSGGLSNLLHDLLTMDIATFDHRTVPQTDALQDQKIHSLAPHEEFWYRRLYDGNIRPYHIEWTAPVQKSVLIEDYLTYAQRLGSSKRANATTFARAIERWCPGIDMFQANLRGRDENGDPRIGRDLFWKFPALSTCREEFERQCGGPFKWREIEVRDAVREQPF